MFIAVSTRPASSNSVAKDSTDEGRTGVEVPGITSGKRSKISLSKHDVREVQKRCILPFALRRSKSALLGSLHRRSLLSSAWKPAEVGPRCWKRLGMFDYAAYRARRTFGSLDGFRCVSILAVIWHHSHGDMNLGRLGTRGFLGVDMFFVLSAFLIVTLLLRERDRNAQISLKAFYARRTLRIMPLYYGVVIGTALLSMVFGPDGETWQSMRHSLPYLLTDTTFTPILLGVLLAHILHTPRGFERVSRVLGHRTTSLWLSVTLIMALVFMPEDLRGWPRLIIHLLMMGLLASAVVREDHVLAPLMQWPPIVRIGVLSYGMYLLHVFVVHFTELLAEHGLPDPFLFPLVVLGTISVAELSYRFYETPFLRLKTRFAR
jgi:peptidoglycan/LPS O-acetylase OafA/YrhL